MSIGQKLELGTRDRNQTQVFHYGLRVTLFVFFFLDVPSTVILFPLYIQTICGVAGSHSNVKFMLNLCIALLNGFINLHIAV